jgi:hypothetical protein
MPHLENAIAAAFDHLDLVVESLHKAAVIPLVKVIGDLVVPVIERGQEAVKTLQPTGAERGAPGVMMVAPFKTLWSGTTIWSYFRMKAS